MVNCLAFSGTLSENLPSRPVTVPMFVPGTMTVAPMTGSPSSAEMTLPVTVLFCAINIDKLRTSMAMIDKSFLITDTLIIFIEHIVYCFDKKSLIVQFAFLAEEKTMWLSEAF